MNDRPALTERLLCLALLLLAACGHERLELAGTVERTSLELAAPISEVIVELPVAIGERVASGQMVVKLDSEVAEAELRAYEAAHSAARAAEKEARGEYERITRLRQANVSTQQALDKARRQLDEAAAVLAEKEARIAQAHKRLRDLNVTSLSPGVVDQLPYEVGERVPAGGVVAVVLADENPWVRVWLPARAVARITDGITAEVRVEGFDETMHGRVADVAREPGFTPHYALTEREGAHLVFETRIVLEDAPADLRPGLPAQVRLSLPGSRDGGAAADPG